MLIDGKKIAIVGGGPGGLTLARLLQLKNADVKVYERDLNRNVRVQGATLDLHEESGLAALRKAGLILDFFKNYRPEAGKLRILDKDAVIYADDHDNKAAYADERPEIDRGPLREILLDSLKPETVVWDSNFQSMEEHGDGWKIHFKNGTSAYADLVIACDGANSKIRPFLSDIKPIYSGVTILEGNISHAAQNAPKLWKLVNGGKVFVFGEEKSIILSAKGDGNLSFYTGTKELENWISESGIDFSDKSQVSQWFQETFGSWHPIWQELFESDDIWFIPRPQYHFPLDQLWETQSNLTMIGDAAHRMPPYAGEGVNMAMLDALELSDNLTNNDYNSPGEALAEFEKAMINRTSAVTKFTLRNTEMLHSAKALEGMLAVMKGE